MQFLQRCLGETRTLLRVIAYGVERRVVSLDLVLIALATGKVPMLNDDVGDLPMACLIASMRIRALAVRAVSEKMGVKGFPGLRGMGMAGGAPSREYTAPMPLSCR